MKCYVIKNQIKNSQVKKSHVLFKLSIGQRKEIWNIEIQNNAKFLYELNSETLIS